LISVTWNNLALPLIADKLVLASEIMVKILVPFIGTQRISIPPLPFPHRLSYLRFLFAALRVRLFEPELPSHSHAQSMSNH